MDRLEREFAAACAEAVRECKQLKYDPTAWISMSTQLGAAEAARHLLLSGDIQAGFQRLVDLERPDLTIEWAVLDPRWKSLFSDQLREAARWRLHQAGVDPPD